MNRDLGDPGQKIEKALRETEERYRVLFENANDVIFTHDLEGNLTSLNRQGEQILGYTRDEVRKMKIWQVLAPEYSQEFRTLLDENAASGARDGGFIRVAEIVKRDGARVPLEISVRVLFRDGRPFEVHGIARNISERKDAEELVRALLRALM